MRLRTTLPPTEDICSVLKTVFLSQLKVKGNRYADDPRQFAVLLWDETHISLGVKVTLNRMPHGGRKLVFEHIDVFTRKPFEGNPLAVFHDGRGLSGSEMQLIAREMHLSETTFVLPRERRLECLRGVRIRIFTVEEELPFAGHPTLGTAWVLKGKSDRKEVRLDLNVGQVPVRFCRRDGESFGEMTQPEPKWGETHRRDRVASALGVTESDFDTNLPIETVSTGNTFAMVPFKSLGVLQRLRPNVSAMEDYLRGTDAKFLYLVSKETMDPDARLHARMIFYGGEDPATGSAAGPAAAWMLRHGLLKPEEEAWIEQGIEIYRPSQIFVRVGGSKQRPRAVRVGGYCSGPIRGELRLPPS